MFSLGVIAYQMLTGQASLRRRGCENRRPDRGSESCRIPVCPSTNSANPGVDRRGAPEGGAPRSAQALRGNIRICLRSAPSQRKISRLVPPASAATQSVAVLASRHDNPRGHRHFLARTAAWLIIELRRRAASESQARETPLCRRPPLCFPPHRRMRFSRPSARARLPLHHGNVGALSYYGMRALLVST